MSWFTHGLSTLAITSASKGAWDEFNRSFMYNSFLCRRLIDYDECATHGGGSINDQLRAGWAPPSIIEENYDARFQPFLAVGLLQVCFWAHLSEDGFLLRKGGQ